MKTVLELFKAKFPWQTLDPYDRTSLKEMPLNTECGKGCRSVINTAVPLLKHVTEAFGPHNSEDRHWKGDVLRGNISEAVLDVCLCFING